MTKNEQKVDIFHKNHEKIDFSQISRRFRIFTNFPLFRQFSTEKWPKMTEKWPKNDRNLQILGQVWVLEPSFDCKQVSRMVPEQVPVVRGVYDTCSVFYHSFYSQNPHFWHICAYFGLFWVRLGYFVCVCARFWVFCCERAKRARAGDLPEGRLLRAREARSRRRSARRAPFASARSALAPVNLTGARYIYIEIYITSI